VFPLFAFQANFQATVAIARFFMGTAITFPATAKTGAFSESIVMYDDTM
jgi:hypothetical protein